MRFLQVRFDAFVDVDLSRFSDEERGSHDVITSPPQTLAPNHELASLWPCPSLLAIA